jgi:type IV secretory pathway VirB6-like protein
MLCNTIILASATILALLLTLLGISSSSKSKLKKAHYQEVLNIAKLDTVLFIAALILFQFFNIPITEADNIPPDWYKWIYWITLFTSSLISGVMVIVILMLYTIVTNIIAIVGMEIDHPLVSKEEKIENEEE